ncbi:hypothetical protein BHE74_00044804 [Ensete ventricosum]|nr:hypothetical protein BHE74_00044804 [Ensete ventricosum]
MSLIWTAKETKLGGAAEDKRTAVEVIAGAEDRWPSPRRISCDVELDFNRTEPKPTIWTISRRRHLFHAAQPRALFLPSPPSSNMNPSSAALRLTRSMRGVDVVVGTEDNPLMAALHHLMDLTVAGKAARGAISAYVWECGATASTPADVKELPSKLVFEIDMPGVKPGDVRVQVEDGRTLVVSGERMRCEDGEAEYVSLERRVGKFMRKFMRFRRTRTWTLSRSCARTGCSL